MKCSIKYCPNDRLVYRGGTSEPLCAMHTAMYRAIEVEFERRSGTARGTAPLLRRLEDIRADGSA